MHLHDHPISIIIKVTDVQFDQNPIIHKANYLFILLFNIILLFYIDIIIIILYRKFIKMKLRKDLIITVSRRYTFL